MPPTNYTLLDSPTNTIDYHRTALVAKGYTSLMFEGQDKSLYRVHVVPVHQGDELAMLFAADAGASLLAHMHTPLNKFEFVRGQFPIAIAQQLVLLISRLNESTASDQNDSVIALV